MTTEALGQAHVRAVYIACAGVQTLLLGGRCALFHEGRQQLVELNATARWIWEGLQSGEPPEAIEGLLSGAGATEDVAHSYVDSALDGWLDGGWVQPADLDQPPVSGPLDRLDLRILGVGFSVEIRSGAAPTGAFEMLDPLRGEGPIDHRLEVFGWGDRYFLLVDGFSRGRFAAAAVVPAIKAAITERLSASVSGGFLTHGALLERASHRVLLSGRPGAGKSTLALALVEAGWRCLADDIVLVGQDGLMSGAPFAPTLKAGAWALLPRLAAAIDALPVHRRSDGHSVRYGPHWVHSAEPGEIDFFVALERRAEEALSSCPLSALDALRSVLENAFAGSGRAAADQVAALTRRLGRTQCLTLYYTDAGGAAEKLSQLVDG